MSFRYNKDLHQCSIIDVISDLIGYTGRNKGCDIFRYYPEYKVYPKFVFPGETGSGTRACTEEQIVTICQTIKHKRLTMQRRQDFLGVLNKIFTTGDTEFMNEFRLKYPKKEKVKRKNQPKRVLKDKIRANMELKLVDIFDVLDSCLPQLQSEEEVKRYLTDLKLYETKWEDDALVSLEDVVRICHTLPDITDEHREFVIRQIYLLFDEFVPQSVIDYKNKTQDVISESKEPTILVARSKRAESKQTDSLQSARGASSSSPLGSSPNIPMVDIFRMCPENQRNNLVPKYLEGVCYNNRTEGVQKRFLLYEEIRSKHPTKRVKNILALLNEM